MSDAAADGQVEATGLGAGRYLVTDGGRRRIAYAANSSGAIWVFLDGLVHVVLTSSAGRRATREDDKTALAAPMPATVVSVNVVPGQKVGPGDIMILLEAMKMELPVKAPREGTVKAIRCQPGQLVQAGVPLVELE